MTDWFYTDIVKDHFFNPRNIAKSEEEMKAFMKKANGHGQVGSPACLVKDTHIHEKDKMEKISKIGRGVDVINGEGGYNKVTETYKRKVNEEVIKIKNQLGEAILTKDHLIYVIPLPLKDYYIHNKAKKKIPPTWVHAGEVKKRDICLYPISRLIKDKKYVEIPLNKRLFDYKSKKIPSKVRVTPQLLKLLGFFVAEGSTKENAGDICFSFNINEESFIDYVKRALKEIFDLDASMSIKREQNKIDVLVYNVHLARYLRDSCGKGASYKRVPKSILSLRPELQKNFIYALWHGDGYISLDPKKPRAEYSTTSRELVNQLKILLLRQKIKHSIYIEPPKKVNGVNHKQCYRVHVGEYEALKKMSKILKVNFYYPKINRKVENSWFENNFYYLPIKKVEKTKYKGEVFNLEVEQTHTYLSESLILHNCGDVMDMWIYVKDNKIKECRWRTFGCASAIASTSILSEMIIGMSIEKAMKIRPQDIVKGLGDLPARKLHCSVLGDKALRAAIEDYKNKK